MYDCLLSRNILIDTNSVINHITDFSVDKFIAQQVSYKKAMDVVCKSDIGSFKTVIDEAKKTCFVLFLKSLASQRDFVEGIRRYRTIEKDYSFLYTDFMHAIYYFITICWLLHVL